MIILQTQSDNLVNRMPYISPFPCLNASKVTTTLSPNVELDTEFVEFFNECFLDYSGNPRQKYNVIASIAKFGLTSLQVFKYYAQVEIMKAKTNKNEGLALEYLFFHSFIQECINDNEERYQQVCDEEETYYSNLIIN